MKHDNNRTFIPTMDEWRKYYQAWSQSLSSRLSRGFPLERAQEAVHSAFLKVTGLSPNLHLEKPMKPMTEAHLYGFLYHHARAILGHELEKDTYWRPEEIYRSESKAKRMNGYVVHATEELAPADFRDGLDREQLDRDCIRMMAGLCRRESVSLRDTEIFFRLVALEQPPRDVANLLWGEDQPPEELKKHLNIIYVAKSRVTNILRRHRKFIQAAAANDYREAA